MELQHYFSQTTRNLYNVHVHYINVQDIVIYFENYKELHPFGCYEKKNK